MFAKKYSIWFMIYQTVSSYLIFYFRYPPSWGKSTLSSFYGWGKFAPFFQSFFRPQKRLSLPRWGWTSQSTPPTQSMTTWRSMSTISWFWPHPKPPILTSIQTSNFDLNPNLQFLSESKPPGPSRRCDHSVQPRLRDLSTIPSQNTGVGNLERKNLFLRRNLADDVDRLPAW